MSVVRHTGWVHPPCPQCGKPVLRNRRGISSWKKQRCCSHDCMRAEQKAEKEARNDGVSGS